MDPKISNTDIFHAVVIFDAIVIFPSFQLEVVILFQLFSHNCVSLYRA